MKPETEGDLIDKLISFRIVSLHLQLILLPLNKHGTSILFSLKKSYFLGCISAPQTVPPHPPALHENRPEPWEEHTICSGVDCWELINTNHSFLQRFFSAEDNKLIDQARKTKV